LAWSPKGCAPIGDFLAMKTKTKTTTASLVVVGVDIGKEVFTSLQWELWPEVGDGVTE